MTAATMTVPADVIVQAHAALHVAMDGPVFTSPDVAWAALAVHDALEVFEAVSGGALHWEFAWPHLRDEADPHGAALLKAAEEAESASGDLIAALAANSGDRNVRNTVVGVTA